MFPERKGNTFFSKYSHTQKNMKFVGNILWLVFGGLIWGLTSFLTGVLLCITIIFIPVGLQFFKIGKFCLWPMGKKVVDSKPNGFKSFINILWAIFFGWEYFLGYGLTGVLLCITIIGIPFGKQYFKLAFFVLTPLGHDFAAE